MKDDNPDPTTREVGIPIGLDSRGNPAILRVRGDETGPKEAQVGVVVPVEDGKPLPPGGDLVHLRSRGRYWDVETLYDGSQHPMIRGKSSGGGWKPLGVSREKFEANWARIFGGRDRESDPTLN